MPLPSPPYTYNDARLTYNEHCFEYNGGYDETCLVIGYNSRRRVGIGSAGGAAAAKRREPEIRLPWIDIKVTAQLLAQNDEPIEDGVITTQGAKGELSPGSMTLLATRNQSEESQINYVAEALGTRSLSEDSNDKAHGSITVEADPLTAHQAGRSIPLANLRPKSSTFIFRTEVTSSSKTPETPEASSKNTTETKVEMPDNLSISASLVITNTTAKKPQ